MKRKKLHIFFSLTLLIFLLFTLHDWNIAQSRKSVLFISSYSESFETVPLQLEGILSVLEPHQVVLDIEYMDTRRFNSRENIELFYAHLKYKLSQTPTYDAIIVGDDNALDFATAHQSELFHEIPIFFMGINDYNRAETAAKDAWITGIIESFSLRETIELGLSFNPRAKEIIALVDGTTTGVGDKNQFYDLESEFPTVNFEHISAEDYSFEKMKPLLQSIEDDAVLIFMTLFEDAEGHKMSIADAITFLTENTQVPIYRTSIGGVGEGLLGGKMVSYHNQGAYAAQMAIDYFNGTRLSDIPMVDKSPNAYFIDYAIVEKYNLPESKIPEEAILINKPISFFEENRSLMIGIFTFIVFLIAIILYVSYDNMRYRTLQKDLNLSHEELIASEEELRSQYELIQSHTHTIEKLNNQYEVAIKGTNSGVWELDYENKQLTLSTGFESLYARTLVMEGYPREVLPQLMDEITYADIISAFETFHLSKQDDFTFQYHAQDGNQQKKWFLVKGRALRNYKKDLVKLTGIAMDITKVKEQEAYIDFLAYHDYLTALPNRLNFIEIFEETLSKRQSGAVLLLDLDNFKNINDTMGHYWGDILLKEIAIRLNQLSDEHLFVSRFGGDEFLLLIKDITSEEEILKYVHAIQNVFIKPFTVDDSVKQIQFSMGITQFPKDSEDLNQLIIYADTAMYNVKYSGKNNSIFFKRFMLEALNDKIKLESILLDALANDGFKLLYQPQVHTKTLEIVGFEALIRLKNHSISPADFIDVAEEQGCIKEIGRWVTAEAISQLASWFKLGLPPKFISINFSSKQINDEGYIPFLKACLTEHQIPPELIEIEITESILLEEDRKCTEFLDALRRIGVNIALDDFGTGYSSINYLTYMPLTKIKLDKSLIDKFFINPSTKLLENIITLVGNLDLEITAEGIEFPHQYMYLKNSNCDYIQGYLFSKPLTADEIPLVWNKQLNDKVTLPK